MLMVRLEWKHGVGREEYDIAGTLRGIPCMRSFFWLSTMART